MKDKTKKRILLIGDGNHQFITNYVHWLKKQIPYVEIDILTFMPIKPENKKYYHNFFQIDKGGKVINKIIYKIKGLRGYYQKYQYKQLASSLPRYDYIHFHYVSYLSLILYKEINKHSNAKLILSIWGSDLYRSSLKNEQIMLEICKLANVITFSNERTADDFRKLFQWRNDNMQICRFGLAPLDKLKELKESKEECKALLGWNPSKLAVTVGYNLSPFQQHLAILAAIKSMGLNGISDKLQLILPITYHGSNSYKSQILSELSNLGLEYKVYDSFLSDLEVAYIRKASDIMIQLQVTDQFSGSMQEHLYAKNVVITGSWLPYETLVEHGVKFLVVDKVSELPEVLREVVNNYDKYLQKCINNSEAILSLSSWEKNIKDWINLYEA